MHRYIFVLMAMVVLFMVPVCAAAELPIQDITAVTADGVRHIIHAEIAQTDEQRTQGLMYRTEMPEDHGMLFVFPLSQPLGFWMRNTLISLDMVFLNDDGLVSYIHKSAIPQDETIIESRGPVSRVLELNGGAAERMGLKVGDRLYNETYFGNKLAE